MGFGKGKNGSEQVLIFFLAASICVKLHFTLNSGLSLFTEEAQYWLWSKHLDWNYYSKPLMIALYNRLGTLLLGDTEVAVRLSAWVFSSLAAWLVYKLSMGMFGRPRYALLAALMVLVMPFFHLASLFHTTDSSLIFFWILSYYLIWRGVTEDKETFWILAGLATAVGILSKNIMVLIIPLTFLYLLIVNPAFLKKRYFYIFVAISALAVVPIIVWNFKHDFVTFRHLGTLGGVSGSSGFDWSNALKFSLEYLAGQLAVVSIFFVPLIVMAVRRWLKHREPAFLFLILPALLIWLMFVGVSVVKRVEVNWPAFAYITLPVVLAEVVAQYTQWRRYAIGAVVVSGALLLAIMYPAPLDALGFKHVLRPQKDPFLRTAGYRELGQRVDFLIDSLQLGRHFVFSDSYHAASELAFYMKGHPQTYNPNLGRRKNQFDLWPGLEQFEHQGYAGVFVRYRAEGLVPAVQQAFDSLMHEEIMFGMHRDERVLTFHIQIYAGFQRLEEMDTDVY